MFKLTLDLSTIKTTCCDLLVVVIAGLPCIPRCHLSVGGRYSRSSLYTTQSFICQGSLQKVFHGYRAVIYLLVVVIAGLPCIPRSHLYVGGRYRRSSMDTAMSFICQWSLQQVFPVYRAVIYLLVVVIASLLCITRCRLSVGGRYSRSSVYTAQSFICWWSLQQVFSVYRAVIYLLGVVIAGLLCTPRSHLYVGGRYSKSSLYTALSFIYWWSLQQVFHVYRAVIYMLVVVIAGLPCIPRCLLYVGGRYSRSSLYTAQSFICWWSLQQVFPVYRAVIYMLVVVIAGLPCIPRCHLSVGGRYSRYSMYTALSFICWWSLQQVFPVYRAVMYLLVVVIAGLPCIPRSHLSVGGRYSRSSMYTAQSFICWWSLQQVFSVYHAVIYLLVVVIEGLPCIPRCHLSVGGRYSRSSMYTAQSFICWGRYSRSSLYTALSFICWWSLQQVFPVYRAVIYLLAVVIAGLPFLSRCHLSVGGRYSRSSLYTAQSFICWWSLQQVVPVYGAVIYMLVVVIAGLPCIPRSHLYVGGRYSRSSLYTALSFICWWSLQQVFHVYRAVIYLLVVVIAGLPCISRRHVSVGGRYSRSSLYTAPSFIYWWSLQQAFSGYRAVIYLLVVVIAGLLCKPRSHLSVGGRYSRFSLYTALSFICWWSLQQVFSVYRAVIYLLVVVIAGLLCIPRCHLSVGGRYSRSSLYTALSFICWWSLQQVFPFYRADIYLLVVVIAGLLYIPRSHLSVGGRYSRISL